MRFKEAVFVGASSRPAKKFESVEPQDLNEARNNASLHVAGRTLTEEELSPLQDRMKIRFEEFDRGNFRIMRMFFPDSGDILELFLSESGRYPLTYNLENKTVIIPVLEAQHSAA